MAKTLSECVEGLKAGDVDARREAAYALADFGPDAVAPLLEALKDGYVGVRWEAAASLLRLGPEAFGPAVDRCKSAIPVLVEQLRAGNPLRPDRPWLIRPEDLGLRVQAAWTLGRMGPDATAALLALLQVPGSGDEDGWDLNFWVASALGRIAADPARMRDLFIGLTVGFEEVQTEALEVLEILGPSAARKELDLLAQLAVTGDCSRNPYPDPPLAAGDPWADELRSRIVTILVAIGPDAVPAILDAVHYVDHYPNAYWILERFGRQAWPALPPLIGRLDEIDPLWDEEEVDGMVPLLKSIGPAAVAALEGALDGGSSGRVLNVAGLLLALSAGGTGVDSDALAQRVIETLKAPDEHNSSAAIDLLIEIGPGAIPAYAARLEDENRHVCLGVASAIVRMARRADRGIAMRRVIDAARRLLEDASPEEKESLGDSR